MGAWGGRLPGAHRGAAIRAPVRTGPQNGRWRRGTCIDTVSCTAGHAADWSTGAPVASVRIRLCVWLHTKGVPAHLVGHTVSCHWGPERLSRLQNAKKSPTLGQAPQAARETSCGTGRLHFDRAGWACGHLFGCARHRRLTRQRHRCLARHRGVVRGARATRRLHLDATLPSIDVWHPRFPS